MITGILIVILSIVLLIVIHELGHFLVAKKFGVKVEEFGIGIPPRIFGKKIGETIYSLNLLPIGAFVKILGEDDKVKDPRSFSEKPIWQRFLIVAAGVISFWLVAFVLLTIMANLGMPTVVADDALVEDSKVQIIGVEKDSPAYLAGLKVEDIIKEIEGNKITKISQVQKITAEYTGEETSFLISRAGKTKEVSIFPEDEIIGVHLVRTAIKEYSWYQAPTQGFLMTGRLTAAIVISLGDALYRLISRTPMPDEFEVVGPVGIGVLAFQFLERGLVDYLWLMVLISISLAIFNLLPIPALDGGRLLFLMIEKIKGRPVNPKLEKRLIGISFALLLGLFLIITFRDILRIEAISNLLDKL